jgi:membrane associated rhomboid family serine protease
MYSTFILVGICAVAFLIQIMSPAFTDAFALISAEVLYRPWTLITTIFLHADVSHLLYNMFALVLFGMILENIIGQKRFLAAERVVQVQLGATRHGHPPVRPAHPVHVWKINSPSLYIG